MKVRMKNLGQLSAVKCCALAVNKTLEVSVKHPTTHNLILRLGDARHHHIPHSMEIKSTNSSGSACNQRLKSQSPLMYEPRASPFKHIIIFDVDGPFFILMG